MVKDTKRTREQLNRLRKIVGGSMAVCGLVILVLYVMLGLANMPVLVVGLVLFILGAVLAASMRVFEVIIQLLGASR